MNLLKQEDVKRNKQVIAVGYGKEYEKDTRRSSRPLKFTKLNIFSLPGLDLNVTITSDDPHTKTCRGMC